jgi:hypothetical protein
MADRFCRECGHELRPEDRFCPNCGKPVHETAVVPTPEADVPTPSPPPQGGWQRFREGWQGTGQEGTRFSDPGSRQEQSRSMFGSAFGVGLGGCLGIIAAFIVVFFLIAFCAASLGGGA